MPPTYDHGIIYRITSPSGKSYVGQTIRTLKQRMAAHLSKGSGCTILKRAIQKYGIEQMKVDILWKGPVGNLNEKECFFIKQNNTLVPNGYNLMSGGGCSTHSIASKRKISDSIRKLHEDPEHRKKIKLRTGTINLRQRNVQGEWVLLTFRTVGPAPKEKHLGYHSTRASAEAALAKYKSEHPDEFYDT